MDLTYHELEELVNIVHNGPVFAGDVISHQTKDALFKMGLVTRVVVKGVEGYIGATAQGYNAYLENCGTSATGAEARAWWAMQQALRYK